MRLVIGFHLLPFEERLLRLALHSLNMRHLREDLIAEKNVFSEGLDLDLSLFFIPP